MAKKEDTYKDRLNSLAGSLKSKPVVTPVQEVRPVQDSPTASAPTEKKKDLHEGEMHVNFWGDKALVQRVKVQAVLNVKTIKDICSEALEAYLAMHSK